MDIMLIGAQQKDDFEDVLRNLDGSNRAREHSVPSFSKAMKTIVSISVLNP
jgi:hypothetical protein